MAITSALSIDTSASAMDTANTMFGAGLDHDADLDRHEIISAEGLESESFHPGPQVMGDMDVATRAELLTLFPGLRSGYGPAGRPEARARPGGRAPSPSCLRLNATRLGRRLVRPLPVARFQSRKSSLMPVLDRVCSSTRLTITAQ
ncbi:hypothetical protein DQW77_14820 [Roseovarius sp. TE539]|uniref:hypothetical protein n=1 Tax=Roseovarius sp. TE539 TaxID=2249812 RepID=UPI000DDCD846|nr:hypothetical protein [Roseovarius sp. TE539]RBI69945.1 hypothetical protein DQW77_14820 [Roseovarius sp. TE539]